MTRYRLVFVFEATVDYDRIASFQADVDVKIVYPKKGEDVRDNQELIMKEGIKAFAKLQESIHQAS